MSFKINEFQALLQKPTQLNLRTLLLREQGQAMVEYVLMLVFVITVLLGVGTSFRQSSFQIWVYYAKKIAAACPQCPPDPALALPSLH